MPHPPSLPRTPTGLFVIRAWTEPGASDPLRATMRSTTDVARGFQVERTVHVTDQVCDEVRRWLEDLDPGAEVVSLR